MVHNHHDKIHRYDQNDECQTQAKEELLKTKQYHKIAAKRNANNIGKHCSNAMELEEFQPFTFLQKVKRILEAGSGTRQ